MSTSTWTVAVSRDWDDADNWSPAGVPGASSDVTIAIWEANEPVASASIGTVNSITDSSDLSFESAGTNTVATFVHDEGYLRVDANGGEGGTILNVGGALTDSGHLHIGNATLSASDEVKAAALDNRALDNRGGISLTGSSADQALLDVTGRAGFGTAEVLSGHIRLAGDSAIEFKSGEITSLADDAQLTLDGNDAFIEDSTAPGSNSALTGLASIGAGAVFGLHDGASVSTTGALVNDGHLRLDIVSGDGGSSLTLAGALTNRGSLKIGNARNIASLSASDKVTATSIDNTGKIFLAGSNSNQYQALLDVTTGSAGFGVAGTVTGSVSLDNDSAIEFLSGQISTIATGASLSLSGDSFVEDSTALGSNSALMGLASIGAGAALDLENSASVTTTGALVNDGDVYLTFTGGGGTSLTVAGTLTNTGFLFVGDNYEFQSSNKVTADTLSNSGTIALEGLAAGQVLDVTMGVTGFGTAGTLTGAVSLNDNSAIEFASGQISTLAAGATLSLAGNNAFIEDSTALGSNSALMGLASIGAGATLQLDDDASLSTTGSVTNSGSLDIQEFGGGGSTLSIAGALTNGGTLVIGNIFLDASASVTAKSFVNSGTVNLTGVNMTGSKTTFGTLNVSGTVTNNGSISIVDDTEELAGPVDGAGSFSLSKQVAAEATPNLVFDSSVSAGQTITLDGGFGNALTLEQAQSFAATISGFGTGDTIDAANFLLSGTTYNFAENSGGTGGTLTLHDGSLTANILMTGSYTKSDFTLAPNSGTGTLVKFV